MAQHLLLALHKLAIIATVGPLRVALDSVLIVAVIGGVFWAGKLEERMSSEEGLLLDQHARIVAVEHSQAVYEERVDAQHAQMFATLATLTANQIVVMKTLDTIAANQLRNEDRINTLERKIR